jgi:hypothetical protein
MVSSTSFFFLEMFYWKYYWPHNHYLECNYYVSDRRQAFKSNVKFLSIRKMDGLVLQKDNSSLNHGWRRRVKLSLLIFLS